MKRVQKNITDRERKAEHEREIDPFEELRIGRTYNDYRFEEEPREEESVIEASYRRRIEEIDALLSGSRRIDRERISRGVRQIIEIEESLDALRRGIETREKEENP